MTDKKMTVSEQDVHLIKLLRAIASGIDAQASGHALIFEGAAQRLEQLTEVVNRLKATLSMIGTAINATLERLKQEPSPPKPTSQMKPTAD
jgi:uncharacterized protein HemX